MGEDQEVRVVEALWPSLHSLSSGSVGLLAILLMPLRASALAVPSTWPTIHLPVHGILQARTLQYFCLENPMDRGSWWATVHGVTKSQIQHSLNSFPLTILDVPCERGVREPALEGSSQTPAAPRLPRQPLASDVGAWGSSSRLPLTLDMG